MLRNFLHNALLVNVLFPSKQQFRIVIVQNLLTTLLLILPLQILQQLLIDVLPLQILLGIHQLRVVLIRQQNLHQDLIHGARIEQAGIAVGEDEVAAEVLAGIKIFLFFCLSPATKFLSGSTLKL